jgi:hypothetical protein
MSLPTPEFEFDVDGDPRSTSFIEAIDGDNHDGADRPVNAADTPEGCHDTVGPSALVTHVLLIR